MVSRRVRKGNKDRKTVLLREKSVERLPDKHAKRRQMTIPDTPDRTKTEWSHRGQAVHADGSHIGPQSVWRWRLSVRRRSFIRFHHQRGRAAVNIDPSDRSWSQRPQPPPVRPLWSADGDATEYLTSLTHPDSERTNLRRCSNVWVCESVFILVISPSDLMHFKGKIHINENLFLLLTALWLMLHFCLHFVVFFLMAVNFVFFPVKNWPKLDSRRSLWQKPAGLSGHGAIFIKIWATSSLMSTFK